MKPSSVKVGQVWQHVAAVMRVRSSLTRILVVTGRPFEHITFCGGDDVATWGESEMRVTALDLERGKLVSIGVEVLLDGDWELIAPA